MHKRIVYILLSLMLLFSFPCNVFATDETQMTPNESIQNVITDFSEPRKILSDPDFDLSSVDQEVLEAWYKQTVVIPDATLNKSIKNAAGVASSEDVTVADMLGLMGNLDLSDLGISSIVGLEYAINVTSINLSNNHLTSLETLKNLYKLQSLNYSNNQLKIFPGWLFTLESLVYLNGNNNNSTVLSAASAESILEELYLEGNNFTNIPSLESCKKLQVLSLANNHLTEFSDELLILTTIKNLSLAGNQIKSVPDLSPLVNLKSLNLSKNEIEEFPSGIYNLPALRELNLSSNKITQIPDTISDSTISVLYMNQNQITQLPLSFADTPNLTILDIGVNYIDLTNSDNALVVENLIQKLDTFHYKIQIPNFVFEMHQFEDYPSGKLVWNGISDLTDETEGSLIITKYVLERIEETITETPGGEDEQTAEQEEALTENDGTKPSINIYKEIATLDPTVTEYIDETASPGKDYTYRLTAYATCNYLGEASFEISIIKTVNTVNMIIPEKDPSETIKLIAIGIAIVILIFCVVFVINHNSKSKKHKRKKARRKKVVKKKNSNKRPISNNQQKGLKKNKTENKNEKYYDEEYPTDRVYLEEKIDKYLKESFDDENE